MSLEREMRAVLLAMRMLGGGRTQAFNASGGKSENPDPRPSGEAWTMADHWTQEWRNRPIEETLEAARAELQAWKKRQAPADDVDFDEDAWILSDGEGFSAEQVARKFNRTPSMVRRLRLRNRRETEFGLVMDPVSDKDRSEDRVVDLNGRGCSWRQIAAQTGLHKTQVQRILARQRDSAA